MELLNKAMTQQKELDMLYSGCKTEESFNEFISEHEMDLLLAFKMELFEVINEVEYFKYWKQHKKNDGYKIAEELGDAMCFGMSILNHAEPDLAHKIFYHRDPIITECIFNQQWSLISKILLSEINTPSYFSIMYALAEQYNLDLFECHDSVMMKNKERLKNNY